MGVADTGLGRGRYRDWLNSKQTTYSDGT